MESKSQNNSYFLWPFRGLSYFVAHPKMWWLPILTTFILTIILLAVFLFVMVITWPSLDMTFWIKLWHILKSFGYSTTALLVAFIVLMPIVLTLALDKMVRKILLNEEGRTFEVGFFRSIYSGTIIFFKTLFWRIFWPIVGLIGVIFLGPIGAFISQLGIGHLAIIDGVDLTLALKGLSTDQRISLYKKKRGEIFCMGFFAAILSMGLSITVVGWLIWIPSVFTGTALWVKDWPELKEIYHTKK
ncbi:MAG: hypothetical protein S4CHLAM6_14120 [Chlamydiae bacterium]|nr:hypothetical protein [Chlamydiota bacterium]